MSTENLLKKSSSLLYDSASQEQYKNRMYIIRLAKVTNQEEKEDMGQPPGVPWLTKLKSLSSHLGLVLTLVLFTVAGGIVFRELESPNELNRLRQSSLSLKKHREQYLLKLQNVSDAPLQYLDNILLSYEKSLKDAVESGIDVPLNSNDNPDSFAKWNYLQAIFFASTVLTTIGYGNIAPETVGGRVFCMLFALIGIPLCVSVLADLGQLLAASLPRVPRPQIRSAALKSLVTAAILVALLLLYLSVGAILFMILEDDWSFLDSFYFCLITMTTIGFGDLVPQKAEYMLLCTVYILLGLSITSTIIEAVRLEYEESWKRLQALAEALRRIGEGTADSQSLRRDLGDIINIITDKEKSDWEATVNTIVTNIQPKQTKPKVIEIIIYETSV